MEYFQKIENGGYNMMKNKKTHRLDYIFVDELYFAN